MSIGKQLHDARVRAGFTQEEAADRLGVSRQTISNWENDRTLPDVAYAKSVSEVYGVSLDSLLSGEPAPAATEAETSQRDDNQIGKAFLTMFLCIWVGCVAFFWIFGTGGGFAMFYAIFFYGILFHASSALIAFLIGMFDCWPSRRFFLTFFFGFMHMMLPYMTFSLANTISSGNINPLSHTDFFIGICISAVGIGLGWLVQRLAGWLGIQLERIRDKIY